MRHSIFGALSALLLTAGSAYSQYPDGVYSHFGGDVARTRFYSPSYVTVGGAFPASRGYTQYEYLGPIRPMLPPSPYFVPISGELPATLKLEFPAPATVWLNDVKLAGEPGRVRTLTSPALRPGEQYTFRIRARWERDGKGSEYHRVTRLSAGDLSKIVVLSGNQ